MAPAFTKGIGGPRLALEFFFTGRNLRSEPVITLQRSGNAPALPTTFEKTAAVYTFGLKGVW